MTPFPVVDRKSFTLADSTWISRAGGTGKESIADLSRTSQALSDEAATVMSISSSTGMDATLDVDKQARWPSKGLVPVVEEDEMSIRSYKSSYTAGILMLEHEAIAHDREMPSASFRKPSSEKNLLKSQHTSTMAVNIACKQGRCLLPSGTSKTPSAQTQTPKAPKARWFLSIPKSPNKRC